MIYGNINNIINIGDNDNNYNDNEDYSIGNILNIIIIKEFYLYF